MYETYERHDAGASWWTRKQTLVGKYFLNPAKPI